MSDVDELISEVFGDTMTATHGRAATMTTTRQARNDVVRDAHSWDTPPPPPSLLSTSSDTHVQARQWPVHAPHSGNAEVDFDDNDDSDNDVTARRRGGDDGAASSCAATATAPERQRGTAVHTTFDDDDDDASASSDAAAAAATRSPLPRATARRVVHTVPFPNFVCSTSNDTSNNNNTARARVVCLNQCVVTNCAAVLPPPHRHPTVASLRELDATLARGNNNNNNNNNYDRRRASRALPVALLSSSLAAATTTVGDDDDDAVLSWRKGAFYVLRPQLGNGCLDSHGDAAASAGGCVAVRCLRCHYGVVRLQDAEWCDDDGRLDLYLTLRNYYPDWSRLASCVRIDNDADVGASSSSRPSSSLSSCARGGDVLRACSHAAAYCCQCAWLTVRCAHAVIRAHVADTARYATPQAARPHHAHAASSSSSSSAIATSVLFATQLPLPAGERRRPPLWRMRARKVSKAAKETLPSASSLDDGACTYYVGGWSSYTTLNDLSAIAHDRVVAHTAPDRTQAPLPRTNVLVLPGVCTRATCCNNDNDDDDARVVDRCDDERALAVVQLADRMHIEGVTHATIRAAARRVTSWPSASNAAGDATGTSKRHSDDNADDDVDEKGNDDGGGSTAVTTAFGATRTAEDVCIAVTATTTDGNCNNAAATVCGGVHLVGLLPHIVVVPQMPAAAATSIAGDTASTTSTSRSKLAAARGSKAAATTTTTAAAAAAGGTTRAGSRRKSKTKQTPEEAAEEARQLAAREALLQQQTAEAIARAQQQEAFLMTFAHPHRWARVTVSNMTFATPVTVCSAHVTFRNCRFIDATTTTTTTLADAHDAAATTNGGKKNEEGDGACAALLTVTQYCRVVCAYCTFAVTSNAARGVATAVCAQPTSQLTLDACLFTGVPPHHLAPLPADATRTATEEDAAAAVDDVPAAAAAASATRDAWPAHVGAAARTAVGVSADDACVTATRCRFCYLGTGMLLRGAAVPSSSRSAAGDDDDDGNNNSNSDRHHHHTFGDDHDDDKAPATKRKTAAAASATAVIARAGMRLSRMYMHHMYNSGVVVCEGARGVAVQRSYFADCVHYAIDCRARARRVVLCGNVFADQATPRLRADAQALLQRNELRSNHLVDDNDYSNTYMQATY